MFETEQLVPSWEGEREQVRGELRKSLDEPGAPAADGLRSYLRTLKHKIIRGFQEGGGQILMMKGDSGAIESGWDWRGPERQRGFLGVYSSLPGKRWCCFGSGLERRLRRCFVSRAKLLGHVVLKNKFFLTNWLNNMQLFSMAKISQCRQLNMIQLNIFSKSLWHLCFLKDEVIKKTPVNFLNSYNSVCRA